jgi:hypothetical protein
MLQLNHMDVAKVDRGMLHMLQFFSKACCNSMFSSVSDVSDVYFICVYPDTCCNCVYLDVANVSHICYMCFIRMFTYGCNGFQVNSGVFFKCFRKHVSSVSTVFRRRCLMFSKVDWVLHLSTSHLMLHLAVGSRGAGVWRRGARRVCSPVCAGVADAISVSILFYMVGGGLRNGATSGRRPRA